jgi:Flp pilus assembly protein TadD
MWLATGLLAFSACTAPPSFKDRLQKQRTVETYTDLGNWFGDHKQFQCAAEAFSSAFELKPDSASLAYLWGLSLYSGGDIHGAAEPLRVAEKLNPTDVRPHLALGAALDQAGKTADAEDEWRAALAIDPDSAEALEGLSRDLLNNKDYSSVISLLEKPAYRTNRTALQSLNLGMAYAKTAQLDVAVKVLREGLDTTPDSLALANELSVVLMILGREDEAFSVLEMALEKHPGDLDTQLLYFRSLVTSHNEKAKQVGHKLLLSAPHNWEALYLTGILETREAEWPQARLHLEQAVSLKPDYVRARTALGVVLAKLNDTQGARQQLEQAIAQGDMAPETRYELSRVYKSLGEVEKAKEQIDAYRQLSEAQSERAQAAGKAQMGDQAMEAGDPQKAAALYREAIESNPGEALLEYKLAMALDKSNDKTGELAALDRAIRLNPNLPEAQNQLGYLTIRGGDAAKAEDYFRAAVRASPSYAAAWINLAAAFASEARWQDAKDAVAHALESEPDNVKAGQLQQAIVAAQGQQ